MADAWALKILSGPHVGAEITLDPGIWVLGRHEECDLVLTDDTLAERQIELSISPEGVQVSNLAEGQNIYLSGQPQPSSFILKPYTVVMAGSLYFAVGPSGQPWPELSLSGPPASANPPPASQPSVENFQENGFIETQEAAEPAFSTVAEELDIPTVDDQVDEDDMNEPGEPAQGVLSSWLSKASDLFSQNSPKETITFSAWAKKHPFILIGAGTGLFLSLMIGSFVWLWMQTDPEQTALANITPAQQAEKIINIMNLQDIRLKKLPDGSVVISGYVEDNNVKTALQKALNDKMVPYNFQAIVTNDMRATAASVLEQYGFSQMSIELDTTPGSLVLNGYAANPKEVGRIRDILKQEVHGLVSIVDQVEYQITRLKALRTMLKERNLAQKIRLMETPGKIILKGRLGDASQGYYLKETVQDFREKYNNKPELIIDVTLPATDLATMQPMLKIKSVSLGRIPYVVLDNGEKYLRGAKLKNGYILENINLEYLTLRLGQERIKYFIGGPHGGQ